MSDHALVGSNRSHTNWVLLGLSLLWLLSWYRFSWGYWEDDAYIHLEYARSVLEGHGFMFNGQLSNGDTSPAWVLMLVAVVSSGAPWLVAGKALTMLCALFALWMLWRFVRRLAADIGIGCGTLPAWMLLLFVSSPYVCYWAFSGMEAMVAAGWLMMTSMLLTPSQPRRVTVLAAAACMGLGPLLRPEFVLMLAAGGPFLLQQWWQATRRHAQWQRWALLVLAISLLALPLVAWMTYAWQTFGHVIPNTNAAKQAPPGTAVHVRLVQLVALGFPGALLATVALALGAIWRRHTSHEKEVRCWRGLPFSGIPLLAWLLLVTPFYVLNHTHVQTRYVLVMAPGLMALLWVFAARHLKPRAVLAVSLSTLALSTLASLTLTRMHLRNKLELVAGTEQMSEYIKTTVPRGTPIAVYAIGQFGFLLQEHELIDVGGITRPQASRFLYDEAGRVAWARSAGARYFIWGEAPEPDAVLVKTIDTRKVGWFLDGSLYQQSAPLRLWRLRSTVADANP